MSNTLYWVQLLVVALAVTVLEYGARLAFPLLLPVVSAAVLMLGAVLLWDVLFEQRHLSDPGRWLRLVVVGVAVGVVTWAAVLLNQQSWVGALVGSLGAQLLWDLVISPPTTTSSPQGRPLAH